jgi:hypothetical protein
MERVRHRNREIRRTDTIDPAVTLGPEPDGASGALPDYGVQVISGATVQTLGLAGLRISQAREVLRSILQIDPRTPVLVNGREVPEAERLQAGDTLEFVHLAGEKGAGPSR